jgi:hypothetical protein
MMAGFGEFWPLYLRAHRRRATRAAHYLGILLGTTLTAFAAAFSNPWLLLAGVGGAFAVTVSSHWLFEGRRPLLLGNPLLAAAADLRMFFFAATGRLAADFARHGVDAEWTWQGAFGRRVAGRAASGIAGVMLAVAASVLCLEWLVWWRGGAWQPISLDATLRHWGVVITEIELVDARWVDRLDEAILSVPLTLVLAAAAASALAVTGWTRVTARME